MFIQLASFVEKITAEKKKREGQINSRHTANLVRVRIGPVSLWVVPTPFSQR